MVIIATTLFNYKYSWDTAHSTIALTERYSHLSDGALQGAMRTLDGVNKKPRQHDKIINLHDIK